MTGLTITYSAVMYIFLFSSRTQFAARSCIVFKCARTQCQLHTKICFSCFSSATLLASLSLSLCLLYERELMAHDVMLCALVLIGIANLSGFFRTHSLVFCQWCVWTGMNHITKALARAPLKLTMAMVHEALVFLLCIFMHVQLGRWVTNLITDFHCYVFWVCFMRTFLLSLSRFVCFVVVVSFRCLHISSWTNDVFTLSISLPLTFQNGFTIHIN